MQTTIPAFLDEQAIVRHGAQAGLEAATMETLRVFARRIAADPQLQRVAIAAHHAIYHSDTDVTEAVRRADTVFGGDAGVLHALFVLDTLRLLRER